MVALVRKVLDRRALDRDERELPGYEEAVSEYEQEDGAKA